MHFELVLAVVDDFYENYPGGSLREIALCGWGALPPYVLQEFKKRFPGFKVMLIEDKNEPIVAQGNFITLVRGDLHSNLVARNSYGIRYDIPVEQVKSHPKYNQWLQRGLTSDGDFLPDRALWVVKKGADLFRPREPFIVEGRKRLISPSRKLAFPFTWDIDLIVSARSDVIDSIDLSVRKLKKERQVFTVLKFKWVIHERDVKIAAARNLSGHPYIEFDFRMRVHFNKLRPSLVLSIPAKGGLFTSHLSSHP